MARGDITSAIEKWLISRLHQLFLGTADTAGAKSQISNWLVVDLPLWKMEWKSLGMMTFPIWWENNQNVPNHQPAKVEFEFYLWVCWSCRHFSDRHIITVAKRYLEYVPKLKTSYLEPSGNFEKSIYLREKYENAYLEQDNALRTKHMHI